MRTRTYVKRSSGITCEPARGLPAVGQRGQGGTRSRVGGLGCSIDIVFYLTSQLGQGPVEAQGGPGKTPL